MSNLGTIRSTGSIYLVRFKEPPYGGNPTDVFLFSSIQAIYNMFTKEQIGCQVERLWNIGLTKGKSYQSKTCTITKEPFIRMKRKSAPTSGDVSEDDVYMRTNKKTLVDGI